MASQVNLYSLGVKCVCVRCLFLCDELRLSDCSYIVQYALSEFSGVCFFLSEEKEDVVAQITEYHKWWAHFFFFAPRESSRVGPSVHHDARSSGCTEGKAEPGRKHVQLLHRGDGDLKALQCRDTHTPDEVCLHWRPLYAGERGKKQPEDFK